MSRHRYPLAERALAASAEYYGRMGPPPSSRTLRVHVDDRVRFTLRRAGFERCAALRVIETFELRNYIGPIVRMEADCNDPVSHIDLNIVLRVPPVDGRDGDRDIDIVMRSSFAVSLGGDSYLDEVAFFRGAVRRAIREAHEHELDECMRFDGQHTFDPHAHEKKANAISAAFVGRALGLSGGDITIDDLLGPPDYNPLPGPASRCLPLMPSEKKK